MSTSFPLDGMRVRFAGETNVGMKRAHNEDSFYLPESERLAIVADGMGGHASGEVASKMAVDTIAGFFRATQDEQQLTWPFKMDRGHRYDVNRMVTAIKLANLKIHEQAQKDPRCHGMGTTVVAIRESSPSDSNHGLPLEGTRSVTSIRRLRLLSRSAGVG
jgi:protein phosphatase